MAADNESAADRLLLALDAKIQHLGRFPEIGSPLPEIRPTARLIVHRRYLVLYEYLPANDTAEIIAVVEGERNLSDLF